MFVLAKRNLLIYFRDKSAVFFSLLAVFILIALYVFFLGDLIAEGVPDFPSKHWLLQSWIMAGVLAVTSVTTTLGAFSVLVNDRATNAYKDFRVAPVKRSALLGGYIISSLSIGFLMCIMTLLAANTLLYIAGDPLLSFMQLTKSLGVILLAVLTASSMISFLVSFFRTTNAFSAASTVIGTLLGFLAGIYIPIGTLPSYLQTIIKVFPASHVAALLRQIFMEAPMAEAFASAPHELKENFQLNLGVFFEFSGSQVSPLFSVLYLLITVIVFFILSIFVNTLTTRS
ncbi:ABC transporter [Sporosarcina sp. P37]|uniref:ABC transporter permease n=1 Tax=unclassified Sporosarcina TaxID=2647733 RepID=UPI000A17A376|nr:MULTISPECIES: ABC transporter permease [unclassified Sporosarcina]ARK24069.1 ABC transporter [Sporosarcina sp. P37]PID18538.1 ABC transporter [Sporosarcina sp. P35]